MLIFDYPYDIIIKREEREEEKKNAAAQLLAHARDDFQEAIDSSTKAITEESNFICNWKLLGDVCYNSALLPEKYCFLNVTPGLIL